MQRAVFRYRFRSLLKPVDFPQSVLPCQRLLGLCVFLLTFILYAFVSGMPLAPAYVRKTSRALPLLRTQCIHQTKGIESADTLRSTGPGRKGQNPALRWRDAGTDSHKMSCSARVPEKRTVGDSCHPLRFAGAKLSSSASKSLGVCRKVYRKASHGPASKAG